MYAPVGKSGPLMCPRIASTESSGIVDQRRDRRRHLAQVVRRDVRRHADRDAARAVDQQVRHSARQDRRLLEPVVEVRREIDRVLVDVAEHLHRDAREPRTRCTGTPPRGRRRRSRSFPGRPPADSAARNPAPCARARRTRSGRRAGGTCRARRRRRSRTSCTRAAGHEAELVHRVQHAPVHRLQPVAHVGQRAADDHAHRVVDERFLDLVVDETREDPFAIVRSGHRGRIIGILAAESARGKLARVTPDFQRFFARKTGRKSVALSVARGVVRAHGHRRVDRRARRVRLVVVEPFGRLLFLHFLVDRVALGR